MSARRIRFLVTLALLLLAALSVRLYHLTVMRHGELREKAEKRRRRAHVREARRGKILCRDGVTALALDRPVDDVILDLTEVDPSLSLVTPLSYALQVERADALALLRAARRELAASGAEELHLADLPLERKRHAQRLAQRSEALRCELGPQRIELYLGPGAFEVRDEACARLAPLLGRSKAQLEAELDAAVDRIHENERRDERIAMWRTPHVLQAAASFDVVARVMERAFEIPGVAIRRRYARFYPHPDVAPHLIGYLGLPTPAEQVKDAARLLDGDRDALGLLLGERVTIEHDFRLRDEPYGRRGVEALRDRDLRGTPGIEVVVRDARNKVREVLLDLEPRDGRDLVLTLDLHLQRATQAALQAAIEAEGTETAGAAGVVIDLADGGILALASYPGFDLNRFREPELYRALREDPRKPFLHRATLGFAPGSTWKILNAFALHDRAAGGLSPSWTAECTGRMPDHQRFKCDGYHARTDLVEAIERSCNVYFFKAADEVGLENQKRWADLLGLGRPQVPGLGDSGGFVPGPGYKGERYAQFLAAIEHWEQRIAGLEAQAEPDAKALADAKRRLEHNQYWASRWSKDQHESKFDVRNLVIGQGDVQVSPIQVAQIAALVATEGTVPTPRIYQDTPVEFRQVDLDRAVLAKVKQGMRQVVTQGTASKRSIGLYRLDVAGKTGTAERGSDPETGEKRPYVAWFMGYYPAQRPEIAFAFVVDSTRGHGGGVCGPIARQVLEAYRGEEGIK
ncbi:MAG: penicillin-binding transpeptidase domain-containing protein [Planctomycetota bacterium]